MLDPESGRAAALIEGSSLTAIRTGAPSGAALDLLAGKDSKVTAVIGAGIQGRTQLEPACTARYIEKAFIYDSNFEDAKAFVEEMAGRGLIPRDLRKTSSAKEAVEQADIMCTGTTSTTPVFAASDLKLGTHLSAVGSYAPNMQEMPAETIKRAKVIVDSRAAVLEEAGDLIQPMRAGLFDQTHTHAELAEIILGRKEGSQSNDEIPCFKSVGISVQDAIAANLAIQNARKMKIGQEVDF